MADQFNLSFMEDSTSQEGSKFERKSDAGIEKNKANKTGKTHDFYKDVREGKGAGKYPNYWSYKTRSGHVIQYDDSKGSESITIQHRGGSAMQFLPNGGIHMVAHNGKYDVIFGENRMTITGAQDITVKGEGSMLVYGNYRHTVHGNMEVACTGSYNITAKDVIMNPRDNFSIAGKTGTMKFDDSVQISAKQTAGIVAGKNAILNGKEMTGVGGGKAVYVAGEDTASFYSKNSYLMGSTELHLSGEKAKLTGTSSLDLKGKNTKVAGTSSLDLKGDTVNMEGSGVNVKGDPVKIKTAQIQGLIDKAISAPNSGSLSDPGSASTAEGASAAPPASAKAAANPGKEAIGKYKHA